MRTAVFARITQALLLSGILGAIALGPTGMERLAMAADEGHHEHIGHAGMDAKQADNPAEVRSDLALFTFVVFLFLLAILWKFAWGPISAGLDKREQGIANDIEGARLRNEEAKQLLADYEKRLSGAAGEVRDLIEQGRRDAEHVKQQILAEAKTAAEAEKERAVRDIESATDQALKSLAERSANLAVELAGKIVGTKLKAEDHSRLIQEAIAKFPAESSRN
jgi:F-type H+-transporting ATPase subunit b